MKPATPNRTVRPADLPTRAASAWEPVRAFLGCDVAACEHISPRRPEGHFNGAYRVELADGRRVKLRLLRQPELARAMQAILAELDDPHFPRVLFRHEHCVVEQWIEGRPLGADDTDAPTEAGRLLGRLHARRELAGAPLPASSSTAPDVALLTTQLDELEAAGLLDADAARRLRDDAAAHDPSRTAHGLFHGDLCGENMLRDADGRLHVVDNERLRPGSLAHDLARTHYRWPLDAAARDAFRSAYAAHSGPAPEPDPGELHFWLLRTLIQSAHVRGLRWQGDASAPLRALRALLAGPDC